MFRSKLLRFWNTGIASILFYKAAISEMDCGSYRPVLRQPIPLEVLDQAVNEQLESYLSRSNLFNACRFSEISFNNTVVMDISD